MIRTLGDYYAAKNMADQHLIHSGLDYTLIEPGSLTEDEGTGHIEFSHSGSGKMPIHDVARCLVDCIDTRQSIGHACNILCGDTPIREALIDGA
ncbi:NAD(P)H-binding protein [Bifidobacterium sp. B4081]|uniref:NAD(P)H-binding protein n=1 Tax=unclassified Bifidobacterium TaxID=2608897 RepID=UPI002269DEA8|nr:MULTISPECIES: NAD(P)H-binding protein [unclassified Bifidobacterium]MCX8644830.1 NAD(P)H-binding protein [Bifidobacterium sp. B4077]MCX8646644.1 NAD(P)H-binding protein [Bifidobacterium sp. B4081]MCX8668049.1 NAD(P)H-binding protein [Bifidobacterium sp. B3998]